MENLNIEKKINKNICKFCQYYEEDYLPTEGYEIHLEYCHNKNNKYSFSKNQILSHEIHECNGFKEKIKYYLKKIEQKYDITIIYAIENGSRVWGFANEDSDFDIRFIYYHNNIQKYFTINNKYEDVMMFYDEIYDIVGWDIKKALYLHYKNNPTIYEWLNTNKVYINKFDYEKLPEINKKTLLHHYYNMGKKTWKKYCENWRDEKDLKKLSKKFLYTIRCILTWNIIFHDLTPSQNINQLIGRNICMGELHDKTAEQIDNLLQYYRFNEPQLNSSIKREYSTIYTNLEDWIKINLLIMMESTDKFTSVNKKDYSLYNEILYDIIKGEDV